MHTPRVLDEQAAFFGHRDVVVAEHALEGGHSRARGVGSGTGLAELLRIAEQDQVRRGVRCGKDISKRHLACLVNHEHINAVAEIFTRPKPRCPANDLRVSRADRVAYLGHVFVHGGVITGEDFILVRFLRDTQWPAEFVLFRDLTEKVAYHRV